MTGAPGRCRFDDQGWLQGPAAISHVLTPNRYGKGFGDGRGVVLHTEAGFEAGTRATFLNPVAQVSAFFSVGQDGAITQYVPVGRGMAAWSQGAGNLLWRGVECEDRTDPATPLTAAQLAAVAQILEACSAFDGFPLVITDDPLNGRGLITHGDGGAAWGNHPGCPGPVRRAQRPAILALARAIRAQEATVAVTADGTARLQAIAAAHGTTAARVLHLTATGPAWQPELHDWLDDLFAGKADPAGPVPRGCVLQVPAPGS